MTPPGPRSRELAARLARVESPAVDARRNAKTVQSEREHAPIVYARASGSNVVDVDDNRYVDLAAGFGALLLGHAPSPVGGAIDEQLERLWLALGDVYPSDAKVALCERLARLLPVEGARVLLGSGGADAVTAALKTAVLATGRPGIVAFEGSYHGLSHGPLAACGLHSSFREPFGAQLNRHVTFAPFPHSESTLREAMRVVVSALRTEEVGAVLVEPMLGRGGCVSPPDGFLASLREACRETRTLLVCDEVFTGLGRCGAWLASADVGVVPDVLCLGKGLGSGLPISACIGSDRVMQAWGAHGGETIHTATHFGSPLACAAAVSTLAALEDARLPERARSVGEEWMARLRESTAGRGVVEVRGRGLMIGVVLDGGAVRTTRVARELLERGWIVVTGGAKGDVLTLTPPLDISETLLDAFAQTLGQALSVS